MKTTQPQDIKKGDKVVVFGDWEGEVVIAFRNGGANYGPSYAVVCNVKGFERRTTVGWEQVRLAETVA